MPWFPPALAALAAICLSLTVGRWTWRRLKCQQKIEENQKKVRQQTEELETRLKVDGVLLTSDREKIVQLSVTELLRQLREGQLTAVQVLHAFQAKALEATEKTNCVCIFISDAEAWARELDSRETRGPLHGLPLSVKECYNIAGYDSTLGLTKNLNKPASSDAVIITVLKRKGAVPFCKTNLPQTMLSFECSNPIYGGTVHPENRTRSCGGSTGGEACLIAQRGSPLGLGTDLAGSVRVPVFCCGITGIKLSSDRLSLVGSNSSAEATGRQGVRTAAGVMGPDVDAVTAGVRALLDGEDMYQLDRVIPPLQWQEQLLGGERTLRLGYYEDDGTFPPTPGCRRAVREAVAALRDAGHQMVPFTPPHIPEAVSMYYQFFCADGIKTLVTTILKDEIADPCIWIHLCEAYIPTFVRYLLRPLVNWGLIPSLKGGYYSSYSLWRAMARRSALIRDTVARWRAAGLDACIAPGLGAPAQPLGYLSYNFAPISYTMLYNLLDFPVGMVPVTRETEDDQRKLKDYPAGNDYYRKLTKQATAGAVGMPIGVQVIGLPWQEELVLRGMLQLETALRQQRRTSKED